MLVASHQRTEWRPCRGLITAVTLTSIGGACLFIKSPEGTSRKSQRQTWCITHTYIHHNAISWRLLLIHLTFSGSLTPIGWLRTLLSLSLPTHPNTLSPCMSTLWTVGVDWKHAVHWEKLSELFIFLLLGQLNTETFCQDKGKRYYHEKKMWQYPWSENTQG